ncbi:MAG: 4-hydroxy-tetrahydrodipicolinate synthase [Acidimicrobiia bacterium]|nr:4-hydroxy-tetrahydrodipicolinate synthase [Acidimicrobiia bacterium]
MAPFGTVLTAVVTPFAADGSVDFEAFTRLITWLVDHGSDGVVVSGTTGESPTLSHDEDLALYRAAVDALGGRATVIAGTGANDTAHSIEMTEAAAEIGVDAVMTVTPYYNRPSQGGLIDHFSAIADASPVPVMLYNIPARAGRLIEVPTLATLAEHEQIVAVKDAVENVTHTTHAHAALPEGFAIYSGADLYTLPMMAVGAVGVVSVASHLVGPQVKAMVTAFSKGDTAEALRIHEDLSAVFDLCFAEPSPGPVKGALNATWGSVGGVRLPMTPASDATVDALVRAMAAVTS